MLEFISVNGFKSLSDFNLGLHIGLNVLVGPNGAGKTNVISFLEFLSFISDDGISDAILKSGGIRSIFSLEQNNDIDKSLSFIIKGRSPYPLFYGDRSYQREVIYEIGAEVKILSETGFISISNQTLRVATTNARGNFLYKTSGDIRWDLDISTEITQTLRPTIKLNFVDRRKIQLRTRVPIEPNQNWVRSIELDILRQDPAVFLLPSICEGIFPIMRFIKRDLINGRAFNVVPEKVKQREDLATPPGIRHDGGGLSATLLLLSRMSANVHGRRSRFYSPKTSVGHTVYYSHHFAKILNLFKAVNRSIKGIDVSVDPGEGTISVNVIIEGYNQNDMHVPLRYLSDGTVKWLALVTMIVTSKSLFAIEEPENFLHPHLQREVVQIIRNARPSKSFSLLTTHSETLIDAVEPNELILIESLDGRTRAQRIENPELVLEEVNRTGFGLGFYYTTDALKDA